MNPRNVIFFKIICNHLFFVSRTAERCAQLFLWRAEGNEIWEETAAWRMSYKQTLHGKPNFCNCRAGPATTLACFSESLQSLQVLLVKLVKKGEVHVGGCVLGIKALIPWGSITQMAVKLLNTVKVALSFVKAVG